MTETADPAAASLRPELLDRRDELVERAAERAACQLQQRGIEISLDEPAPRGRGQKRRQIPAPVDAEASPRVTRWRALPVEVIGMQALRVIAETAGKPIRE